MMSTAEARRRASEAQEERLKAAGWRKVTFRADPDMLADLEALKAVHGSLQDAIKAALMAARAQVPKLD